MKLVAGKAHYTGVDLNPLSKDILQCNIETDPLPEGCFDKVVILGVLEYLSDLPAVMKKLQAVTETLVVSYCFRRNEDKESLNFRMQQDWVNDYTEIDLLELFNRFNYKKIESRTFQNIKFFEQKVFLLSKNSR